MSIIHSFIKDCTVKNIFPFPSVHGFLLAGVLAFALSACMPSLRTAPRPEPTVPVTGTVFTRDAGALPETAELRVTLTRRTSGENKLIAEYRVPVGGKNMPLPFSVACPLEDGSSIVYALEAEILDNGMPLLFMPRPQPVHPGDAGFMIPLQKSTGGAAAGQPIIP